MAQKHLAMKAIKGSVYVLPLTAISLAAYHALKQAGVPVAGFCDNDESLDGKSYNGCPVMTPAKAIAETPGATFIIANIPHMDALKSQLDVLGAASVLRLQQILTPEIAKAAINEIDEKSAAAFPALGSARKLASNQLPAYCLPSPELCVKFLWIYFFYDDNGEAMKNSFDQFCFGVDYIAYIRLRINQNTDIGELLSFLRYLLDSKCFVGRISLQNHFSSPITEDQRNAIHNGVESLGLALENIDASNNDMSLYLSELAWYGQPPCVDFKTVNAPYRPEERALRCIDIHIPKNAGSALIPYIFGNVNDCHHKTADVCLKYDPSAFREYFKFCIIRNPWDRLVSLYYFFNKRATESKNSPADIWTAPSFREAVLYLRNMNAPPDQQYPWICDKQDNILVDFVGRFENLHESFVYIAKKLGVYTDRPVQRLNATKHKPYTEYYDEEMIEIVREAYKKDIELFGYEFGKHPGPNIIVNPREDFVPVTNKLEEFK